MKNKMISKIAVFASVIVMLVACGEKPADKEIIVVPGVVVKDAPSSSTTITLDKKGVKVEAEKLEVEVKK